MINTIIFTGHMIDKVDRSEPRFPANKEKIVTLEIAKKLVIEEEKSEDRINAGIAGGACGGDIIFHELCEEMGIPTEMYLALPIDDFKKASVSFAGTDWEKRFNILTKKIPVHILPDTKSNNISLSVWELANLWMLDKALKNGGSNMTLLALWDGKGGDGNGGTEHMVKSANEEGAKVEIININKL